MNRAILSIFGRVPNFTPSNYDYGVIKMLMKFFNVSHNTRNICMRKSCLQMFEYIHELVCKAHLRVTHVRRLVYTRVCIWKVYEVRQAVRPPPKRKRFSLARRLLLGNVARELLPFPFCHRNPSHGCCFLFCFVIGYERQNRKPKGMRKYTSVDRETIAIFIRTFAIGWNIWGRLEKSIRCVYDIYLIVNFP